MIDPTKYGTASELAEADGASAMDWNLYKAGFNPFQWEAQQ